MATELRKIAKKADKEELVFDELMGIWIDLQAVCTALLGGAILAHNTAIQHLAGQVFENKPGKDKT